jgi:aspartate-semialdehyde dehydrogenase
MKVAVVGVTGMVGQVMLQVLEERQLPIDTLIPVASARSVGKKIHFQGKELTVVGMEEALPWRPILPCFRQEEKRQKFGLLNLPKQEQL